MRGLSRSRRILCLEMFSKRNWNIIVEYIQKRLARVVGMNKILTVPKVIEKNEPVLYAGNHYISLPEIRIGDASIQSLNIISLSNKGLVEISGESAFLFPEFYRKGKLLTIEGIEAGKEFYYIPVFNIRLEEGYFRKRFYI